MAPEILRYEKYDAKADLWSVGAVLYEMSVGRPPFRAQNHMELLKKIEHARGRVNFPDEVAAKEAAKAVALGTSPSTPRPSSHMSKAEREPTIVPPDIKAVIRILLKRKPVERATFEEFFEHEAVAPQLAAVDPTMSIHVEKVEEPRAPSPSSSRRTSTDRSRSDPNTSDISLKRKEKPHRDKEPPLEGTPYDPKNYVPRPALTFRRTAQDVLEELDQ